MYPATSSVPVLEAGEREPEPMFDLIELLFFAYRDFVGDADRLLATYGMGRAHHRVLHFVHRQAGLTVAELLDILKITKQSLNRVMKELLDAGFIEVRCGSSDRRQRLLFASARGSRLALDLARLQSRRFRATLDELPPHARAQAAEFLLGMVDPGERDKVTRLVWPRLSLDAARGDQVSDVAVAASGQGPVNPADDAAHLLVVDDDRRIRDLLSRFLRKEGYRVTLAQDAAEARVYLKNLAFDLIVLDAMMPGENGFEFAAATRLDSQVPILMLTARADAEDRVRGLEAGADDYLAKPFDHRELLLRIASILRRVAPHQADERSVRFGPFAFSVERGELRQGEEAVRLTDREREMLQLLAGHAGDTVSRDALAGPLVGANERTIDVQINRLRRKIEVDPANPAHLQTVRGIGYRLLLNP